MKLKESELTYYDLEGRKRHKKQCPYCGRFIGSPAFVQHKRACAKRKTRKGSACKKTNANDAERKSRQQSRTRTSKPRGPYKRRSA